MMTPAEQRENEDLKAQLKAYAKRMHGGLRWEAADEWIAATECARLQAGLRVNNPHPLTEQRMAGDWSLVKAMRDYLGAQHPAMRERDDRAILASAVGTEVLPELLTDTANGVTLVRMPDLLGKVLRITKPVELRNYLPTGLAAFEIDAFDAAAPNFAEWHTVKPRGTAELLGLGSSPVRLRITEQLTLRDDALQALAAIIQAVAAAAAQNEAVACFGLLADNPTLQDGNALFVAGNTSSSTGVPSTTTLEAAISLLRKQTLNGMASDADPHTLICSSDHEGIARTAVRTFYGDQAPIEVIGTAHLGTDAWYLQADPEVFPTLARATMAGAGGNSLRFTPGRPNDREGVRDSILESLHTYAYGAVNRLGVVKVATA